MASQATLEVGQTLSTRSIHLTEEASIGFAKEYDPQPMHLDNEAATAGFFGTLTASGWHVLALTMRLIVEARPFGEQPMIGAELSQIRFLRPILPGTELAAKISFERIEQGRGTHSYNILRVDTIDVTSGDVLVSQNWRMLRT